MIFTILLEYVMVKIQHIKVYYDVGKLIVDVYSKI